MAASVRAGGDPQASVTGVALRCLAGGQAPPQLAGDVRRVLDLPPEALQRFWHVLGPSLREPVGPEVEPIVDGYCRAYQLRAEDLAHVVRACRFLIREAARLDLSPQDFSADVAALQPDDPLLLEILLAAYERGRAQVRTEILRGAIADHGKLVVGIDWRVDTMETSQRGARIRAPVALVTLRYLEGTEAQRITLQLLPDMLEELRSACDKILS